MQPCVISKDDPSAGGAVWSQGCGHSWRQVIDRPLRMGNRFTSPNVSPSGPDLLVRASPDHVFFPDFLSPGP